MSGLWQAIRLNADRNPRHGTVIAKAAGPGNACPAEIRLQWVAGEVCLSWTDRQPIRHHSEVSLAKRRRTRLQRRLAADVPLFADQLAAAELARRPAFFAGKRAV